jgi:hypothetical protein
MAFAFATACVAADERRQGKLEKLQQVYAGINQRPLALEKQQKERIAGREKRGRQR